MFDLNTDTLSGSILGCADGPAAFNAEITRRGGRIVSCDPLYAYSVQEISSRIDECFETVIAQTRLNADAFVWSKEIPDVDSLGATRMAAMGEFLNDFAHGRLRARYVTAELPELPFANDTFDLALCSHFLFLYESLGLDFHVQSIIDLCRVATEVRLFPLTQLDGQTSPYLTVVIEKLSSLGHSAEIATVPYEFQRGASEMLRVTRTIIR